MESRKDYDMPRKRKQVVEEVIEEVESVSSGSMSVEETLDQLTREMDEAKAEIEKKQKRAEANKSSRRNGRVFEDMIERACKFYEEAGLARITKVPEARRVVGRTAGRGSLMICANAAKADPDFMGSVAPDGKCMVFDAKHTDKGKILLNALTDNQRDIMAAHEKCGARCFIAVSFGFEKYFMIPYDMWRDMKAVFGRQYILPDDEKIQAYSIPFEITGQTKKGEPLVTVWFLGERVDVPVFETEKTEEEAVSFE